MSGRKSAPVATAYSASCGIRLPPTFDFNTTALWCLCVRGVRRLCGILTRAMLRYAAVDIGSNSTRMLAAEVLPGEPPRMLAAEREVTRLGESVFRTGRISTEAMEAVLRVLGRMGDTY